MRAQLHATRGEVLLQAQGPGGGWYEVQRREPGCVHRREMPSNFGEGLEGQN